MEILNKQNQSTEGILKGIVIGDGSWLYKYNPSLKDFPSVEKSLINIKVSRSRRKFMIKLFWNTENFFLFE